MQKTGGSPRSFAKTVSHCRVRSIFSGDVPSPESQLTSFYHSLLGPGFSFQSREIGFFGNGNPVWRWKAISDVLTRHARRRVVQSTLPSQCEAVTMQTRSPETRSSADVNATSPYPSPVLHLIWRTKLGEHDPVENGEHDPLPQENEEHDPPPEENRDGALQPLEAMNIHRLNCRVRPLKCDSRTGRRTTNQLLNLVSGRRGIRRKNVFFSMAHTQSALPSQRRDSQQVGESCCR